MAEPGIRALVLGRRQLLIVLNDEVVLRLREVLYRLNKLVLALKHLVGHAGPDQRRLAPRHHWVLLVDVVGAHGVVAHRWDVPFGLHGTPVHEQVAVLR